MYQCVPSVSPCILPIPMASTVWVRVSEQWGFLYMPNTLVGMILGADIASLHKACNSFAIPVWEFPKLGSHFPMPHMMFNIVLTIATSKSHWKTSHNEGKYVIVT